MGAGIKYMYVLREYFAQKIFQMCNIKKLIQKNTDDLQNY